MNFFKPSKYWGGLLAALQSIDEPEKGTIRLKLSEPDAFLLNFIRIPQLSILNAKHIQEGENALKTRAIGTGPFTQEKFVPNEVRVYKRNPNYWLKDAQGNTLPYMDGVVHQAIQDTSGAAAALRTGKIDYLRPTSVEEFNRLTKEVDAYGQAGPGFCGCQTPAIVFSYRDNTFKDPRVRQALSMALDRTDMIDTIFGGAATMRGLIVWYYKGASWPETLDQMGEFYKFDPARAKQLLTAAGVTGTLKVDYRFAGTVNPGTGATTGDSYLEAVRRDLGKIGVELNLIPLDQVAHSRSYFLDDWKGLYNYATGASQSLDAGGYLDHLTSTGFGNGGKLNDPKVDDLAKKAKEAIKVEDQTRIVKEIEDYVAKQQVAKALHLPDRFALSLWRKYVHNMIDSAAWWASGGGAQQFSETWLDDKVPNRNIDSF